MNDTDAGAGSYEIPPELNIASSSGLDTVIELEGGLDVGVPTVPNQVLYIYFPILDEDLPDLEKLDALAVWGRDLQRVPGGRADHGPPWDAMRTLAPQNSRIAGFCGASS